MYLVQAAFRQRVEEAGYTSALVRLLHASSANLQVLATKALARVSHVHSTYSG